MPRISATCRWQFPEETDLDLSVLLDATGVPEPVLRILAGRGLDTAEAIEQFLNPNAGRLHRPDSLPDIGAATDRLASALDRGERICVYGDYDVDGVSGTALLVSLLRGLDADVVHYLPDRVSEGYGLSPAGVDFCRRESVRLLVTNDCGSSDLAEVTAARDAGIDTIVTDHHEPPAQLPPAVAVINPKRTDSGYPFRELAGVGVAFKLAWSLLAALGRPREELTGLLDLVGLGTIADVVPLVGENRILAWLGLACIRQSERPGLRALLRRAGIPDRRLTTYDVGFILGPRINAAGRVSHAREAAELLLTPDPDRAAALAERLDTLNRNRQQLEQQTLNQALSVVEAEHLDRDRVVVVAAPGWPHGVIGVVASRLVEKYYRPCIVISLDEGRGRGSGRSISGFDLYESLGSCADELAAYGGHRHAVGLTIEEARIPGFRAAVNRFAEAVPDDVYEPSLRVDAVTRLEDIDERLVAALARLEPFGPRNPTPVFATLGLEVVGYPRRFGKDHLRFTVRSNGATMEAVAWKRSHQLPDIETGPAGRLDLCYTVDRRTYRGRTSTRLSIRDMRSADD